MTYETYKITRLEVGLPVEFLDGSRTKLVGLGELGLALSLVLSGLLGGGGLGLGLEFLLGLAALLGSGLLCLGLALGFLGSGLLGTSLVLNHRLGGLVSSGSRGELGGGSLDGKTIVAEAFAKGGDLNGLDIVGGTTLAEILQVIKVETRDTLLVGLANFT